MSWESCLTSLSYSINFIFSRSKLMDKKPFSHGYHVGTMWLFGYNSATAEPNSTKVGPLESYDLMLFYGTLKSRGTLPIKFFLFEISTSTFSLHFFLYFSFFNIFPYINSHNINLIQIIFTMPITYSIFAFCHCHSGHCHYPIPAEIPM